MSNPLTDTRIGVTPYNNLSVLKEKGRAWRPEGVWTASRLYVMARERGYRGSPDHFRHLIACHWPHQKAEAYLRLRGLPGEEGQVDWAHFGHSGCQGCPKGNRAAARKASFTAASTTASSHPKGRQCRGA